MTPLSEKDGLTYKANYKPITILPNLREYKLHQSHWSQTLSDLSFKLISGNHLKANEERYALLSTNKIVLQNIDKSPSKTVVVKNY